MKIKGWSSGSGKMISSGEGSFERGARLFQPRRAIHLDFHTMPGIYDAGREFKADEFARTLRDAQVDYITVFARCNIGFAYYPTKVGVVYPGLKTDLLGQMVKACHRQNIRVAAYFNAGIDHVHALRHRDWCKVDREGHVYNLKEKGHFFRNPCLNTPYRQHLLDMLEEVLAKYPVDGIFLDCFDHAPCYGVECVEEMKKKGVPLDDEKRAREFYSTVTDRFMKEVMALVGKQRRPIRVCPNGFPYRKQPTHIEIEVLPTAGYWGYEYLPWAIRYARTLKKPYLTMTGRFHENWGDFGGLRPEHSLLFDCYNSIANGGACMVGDHMHPRGKLEKAVYQLIGKAYTQIKQLETWSVGATAVAEMAVIEPGLRDFPSNVASFDRSSMMGATRLLMELKYQFDVVDGIGDLSDYRVIILPDHVLVDDLLKKKLEKHLRNGGIIVSSAWAGLTPDKSRFALDAYKIVCGGADPCNMAFFEAIREVDRDLPEMLTTIYDTGIKMTARQGGKELARLHQPYFNLGSWDGYHENLYIPPEKRAGRSAVIQCGNILHFSFPIFASYHGRAVPAYRTLVRNCLEKVFPQPMIRTQGLPSFVQATVTKKRRCTIAHLLTYMPELRGSRTQMIEEPIEVRNIQLCVRRDGRDLQKAFLAPQDRPLNFSTDGAYWRIDVPQVSGYQMIVLETS
ncbi:MAG: beta-galactosidase trimerization domain-containing protein [Verrucomicrobiae bacterium]|nr:beta-galactosidase trimerization domain-containing protein [Verrucomicrobiae bacterium]